MPAWRAPALLVQGTGARATDSWRRTHQPALDQLGIPWCPAAGCRPCGWEARRRS